MKKHLIVIVSLLLLIMINRTCTAADLNTLVEKEAAKLKMDIKYTKSLDFNHDGIEDLVVIMIEEHSEFPEPEGRFWVVSVKQGKLSIVADLTNYLITNGGMMGLSSELWTKDNLIHYDASGGSSLRWSKYYIFGYRQNKVQVVYYDTSSCDISTGTSDEVGFNYWTSKANHSFERWNSTGDQKPALEGTAIFYVFQPGIVNQPVRIDGVLEKDWEKANWVTIDQDEEMITYGKKNWQGSKDLSMRAKTLMRGQNLYIFAEVTDDQVVWNNTTDLKQDHLEIWLDSERSIRSWNEQSEQVYDSWVYRQTKQGLYQFALYKNKALRYQPQAKAESGIQYAFATTKTGYNVEICIPLDQYLKFEWSEKGRVRFTLVISDTDSKTKPAQDTLLATSALKWGNPFTLGAIVKSVATVTEVSEY